jgi:hypothetical protein
MDQMTATLARFEAWTILYRLEEEILREWVIFAPWYRSFCFPKSARKLRSAMNYLSATKRG